jgi:amino acid transporter
MNQAGNGASPLRRAIRPWMLVAFVVGDILGAGIYARVGGVAAEAGGLVWLAFAVGIAIAALTAVTYGDLASRYPGAGGAALFVQQAFRSPWLTFLVGFAVLTSALTSASAVARVFGGEYLGAFVDLPALPVAVVFVLAIAALNLRGISESIVVNVVCTVVEAGGLLLIVALGAAALAAGTAEPARALELGAEPGTSAVWAVLGGAAVAFYACIGFEDVANLAEEAQDPQRSLPRALLGGLAIAGAIYVAVGLAAVLVVEPEVLAASSAPLLEVVQASPVRVPERAFAGVALLAVSNTALINMIMASRLLYGMADQGVVPRVLARVHPTRRTPSTAIAFTTLVALGLVATGDLGDLADTTVVLLLGVFILVNGAALRLRGPDSRVPAGVPALAIVSCLVLLAQLPAEQFLRAGLALGAGAVLYGLGHLSRRAARTRPPAAGGGSPPPRR